MVFRLRASGNVAPVVKWVGFCLIVGFRVLKDLDAGERIATVAVDFWCGGCAVTGRIEAVVGFFSVRMWLRNGVVAVVML